MHCYVHIYWNFIWFYLLMMMTVATVMIRAFMLCSGPGADGPGREHVATDTQKVLVLLLLTEWLL